MTINNSSAQEVSILEALDKSLLLKISAIEAKAHTLEDLGIDSLHLLRLAMLLEDELKLKVDLDRLNKSSTLNDLILHLKPIDV
jgi:acyl carrier protein